MIKLLIIATLIIFNKSIIFDNILKKFINSGDKIVFTFINYFYKPAEVIVLKLII